MDLAKVDMGEGVKKCENFVDILYARSLTLTAELLHISYAGYLGRRQLLQYRHFQMNFCLADFCFSSCILVSFIQNRS